jgi:glycosyltransferase involved in cell wall biosynthesis
MKIIVCTPTSNRRWSWEFSRYCMDTQLQQPDAWIVVDNSDDPNSDWSISKEHPLVIYSHVDGKEPIGALRNRCIELALENGADYIVFWDDDDYYPPTRISAGVKALEDHPRASISGCSMMYLLLTKENVIMTTGPFHDNHATAATWTIRRSYAEHNRFDPTKHRAEEVSFNKNWAATVAQVKPEDMIVVMGHGRNTVDKSDLLKRPHIYSATIINKDNGKMWARMHWPLPKDLFQRTFSV